MLDTDMQQIKAVKTRRPLEGRAAIVTGSTSGIGLGIARALAEAGSAIMLNGFGDPKEIESVRRTLLDEHEVDVFYNAADMTRPEEIRAMAKDAVERFGE